MKTKKKIIPPIVPKKIPPPAHYNSSPISRFFWLMIEMNKRAYVLLAFVKSACTLGMVL